MGTAKVKLDKDLLARAREVAEAAGYSAVEEFLTHLIEKELAKVEDAEDEEALKERLKGLGYIS
ncbi:MAG: hypothetical protein ACYS99_19470 [Planctomycetota bacterium]|jgi:hypothetical protein